MLHVFCARNMTELVQHLLEKGVDYTILNKVNDFFNLSYYISMEIFNASIFSCVKLPLIWQPMRLLGKY